MMLDVAVQGDTNEDGMTFVIIVSSVASFVTLVVSVLLCTCCYKRKDECDSDEESVDGYHSATPQIESDRDDVKKLRSHSWKERVNAPLLTRKTIKFERPGEKNIVAESVQPDSYSQTSLNKTLGIKSRDPLGASGLSTESPVRSQPENHTNAASTVAHLQEDFVLPEVDPLEYSPEKLGRIQFSLKYDFQEMTLILKVMRAVELPAKDFSGTSDPYVKIMLLPDKKHKLQTNIKRRNLNPRWNEVFAFEGFPFSKLQSRILFMQVLDYDRFSRDDPIGEVALPLGELDLTTGQTMWKVLQPCKGHAGKLGELLVSMCYQPTVGRITVVCMKARELKAKDITGFSDPYVKIWMCHDGKKVEKKKTTIKERTLNPVFNESFIFNVPYEKIRQTSLFISVMDYDRMGRNELIGQVILGSKSGPMEVKHWNEMFSKSRQPVAQWHILKDFG